MRTVLAVFSLVVGFLVGSFFPLPLNNKLFQKDTPDGSMVNFAALNLLANSFYAGNLDVNVRRVTNLNLQSYDWTEGEPSGHRESSVVSEIPQQKKVRTGDTAYEGVHIFFMRKIGPNAWAGVADVWLPNEKLAQNPTMDDLFRAVYSFGKFTYLSAEDILYLDNAFHR